MIDAGIFGLEKTEKLGCRYGGGEVVGRSLGEGGSGSEVQNQEVSWWRFGFGHDVRSALTVVVGGGGIGRRNRMSFRTHI